MEYVYAGMLLHKAGKEVTEENVKKVLEAAGIEINDAKLKALVASLDGVDIEKAIQEAVVTPAASAPAAESTEKAEEKKEEKKEDDGKKQEEAAAGLGALFG